MRILTFGAITALAIVSFHAMGIVIRHDVNDSQYHASPADFPPLATLYQVGAHGTLIAPQWVVTAAHTVFCIVPGSYIEIGGHLREVEARYAHHRYQRGEAHDIALIKLTQPVTDVTPARLYHLPDEAGRAVWFIGSGGSGNGKEGQTISYKENAGTLRKAQNRVREVDEGELFFTFDKGDDAMPFEGVSGNGDSGGPAFLTENGHFYLLGISSRNDSWFKGIGEYGVNEVYTRISYYRDWIDKVKTESDAVLAQYTTNQRFPQPDIVKRLPEVCKKISYVAPHKQKETVQSAH